MWFPTFRRAKVRALDPPRCQHPRGQRARENPERSPRPSVYGCSLYPVDGPPGPVFGCYNAPHGPPRISLALRGSPPAPRPLRGSARAACPAGTPIPPTPRGHGPVPCSAWLGAGGRAPRRRAFPGVYAPRCPHRSARTSGRHPPRGSRPGDQFAGHLKYPPHCPSSSSAEGTPASRASRTMSPTTRPDMRT